MGHLAAISIIIYIYIGKVTLLRLNILLAFCVLKSQLMTKLSHIAPFSMYH